MNISVYIRVINGRDYSYMDRISESALEAAVRLKEKCGFSLTAFSFGTMKNAPELRRAFACGADRICLIESEKNPSPHAEAFSAYLTARKYSSQIVILPGYSEEYSFGTCLSTDSSGSYRFVGLCTRTRDQALR